MVGDSFDYCRLWMQSTCYWHAKPSQQRVESPGICTRDSGLGYGKCLSKVSSLGNLFSSRRKSCCWSSTPFTPESWLAIFSLMQSKTCWVTQSHTNFKTCSSITTSWSEIHTLWALITFRLEFLFLSWEDYAEEYTAFSDLSIAIIVTESTIVVKT